MADNSSCELLKPFHKLSISVTPTHRHTHSQSHTRGLSSFPQHCARFYGLLWGQVRWRCHRCCCRRLPCCPPYSWDSDSLSTSAAMSTCIRVCACMCVLFFISHFLCTFSTVITSFYIIFHTPEEEEGTHQTTRRRSRPRCRRAAPPAHF